MMGERSSTSESSFSNHIRKSFFENPAIDLDTRSVDHILDSFKQRRKIDVIMRLSVVACIAFLATASAFSPHAAAPRRIPRESRATISMGKMAKYFDVVCFNLKEYIQGCACLLCGSILGTAFFHRQWTLPRKCSAKNP
jgi:hypothetical protein